MEETPKAQEGIWTLIAPDGRKWQAENPIKVVTKEQRERVPEHIAIKRILKALFDEDGQPQDSADCDSDVCRECGRKGDDRIEECYFFIEDRNAKTKQMNWTELDYKNLQDRLTDDERESALQKRIVDDCLSRGWLVHSHKQGKSYYKCHTKGAGWDDITVLADRGRTIHIETKAKKGTMRQAQILHQNMCRILGHEYYKIKTWKEWVEVRDK